MDMLRQIEENTTVHRAIPLAVNTLVNLRGMRDDPPPYYAAFGKPLEGIPAFIVGAGPSLDGNIDALRAAAKLGAIIAVNSSAPALAKAGIDVDVLVCVESVDMTTHLADALPRASLLALDVTSHPNAWALPGSPPVTWFAGHGPEGIDLCMALDVPPLEHGGAAVEAAFALAVAWGADPVVLVGHDLSFPSAGNAYADGAGWDGIRCRTVEDSDGVHRLHFEGRQDRDELHHAAGVAPVPRERPTLRVTGWGGLNDVLTVGDYFSQLRWYERQVRVHPRLELVNATEGGARIMGWREQALWEFVDTHRPPRFARKVCDQLAVSDGAPGLRSVITRHLEAIGVQLESTVELADSVLGDGPVSARLAADLCPYCEMMAAPDQIKMRRQDIPAAARLEGLYVSFKRAAEFAGELLR